ncbi:MAG: (Fe-S)-binding protein [Syntrophaceae bacterium]|nr:(Fe-S)-binding protein [Syntrophaceae bacterium]
MFNAQTCKRCGACLIACPFLEMSKEEAKREIVQLIEKKATEKILSSCAGCSYCDYICPTQSNPSSLRKEILRKHNSETGVPGLGVMSEEVPFNIMHAGLETDKNEKLARLAALSNPEFHEEVFYLGCSLSYIYTDLAQTHLLDELPAIGGMKYCCGSYAYYLFGEKEAKIRGRQLLNDLKKIGVKRMVTFCPECDNMLGSVYPALIEEFDIQIRNIVDYLLDKHQNGQIQFCNLISKKVTFHDACGWRKLDPQIYESPRKLLRAMGAEVVEMKHNHSKSMCCGTPLAGKNPRLASAIAEKRVLEAKVSGAEAIVVGCTGCFALSGKAKKHGLDIYYITELAQIACREKPPHRIEETKKSLVNNIITKISAEPSLFTQKYVIKNGLIKPLSP